jgi:uridylate kinase
MIYLCRQNSVMNIKRILLKLSGESLMGNDHYGIDYTAVYHYACEIKSAIQLGVQVGVVIGGGNIFRGVKGSHKGFDRRQGDHMGMLATMINAMALQTVLEEVGVSTKILSALAIDGVCEKSFFKTAEKYIENQVIIFAGGTGNPFFTTDSAAALRAVEIKADLLIKGTRVDGVYTADPEKDKTATKYSEISYDEAYKNNLNILDLTAFTLCKENRMPIYVYDANQSGNLLKVLQGEHIGTIIK